MPRDIEHPNFLAPISADIWDMKYRLKELDGTPIDRTVEDTWRRIAHHLARAEETLDAKARWSDEFYDVMADFKFLPAGRIIAGAGSNRRVTLFNCFVMGTIPDSMDGIFSNLREAALTMQQGGGIGYDFSPLRPKGAPVKQVAADASGPLTFMDVWDSMCRTVMSAGSRRGAMMATMRCDHPDIEEFIEAKADPRRLRMFNLSVLATDAFMEAVKADKDWPLVHTVAPMEGPDGGEPKALDEQDGKTRWVYRVVRARDLWDKIMQSTYDYAEPGVIFIDRVNDDNNLKAIERIAATNPCGEQPLPPYGACLLGSINLARFVRNAFTDKADLDRRELKRVVETAVRMMDNVNDVSGFAVRQQLQEAKAKRRIGLGVTGLADMLAMLRIRYGSEEAERRVSAVMRTIQLAAYRASILLAKEKGPFPAFSKDTYLTSGSHAAKMLTDGDKDMVREHGIRNSHLTSIAPTGTISLYAGNVSSGIEPIFAYSYNRKVLLPDGSHMEQLVEDYAVAAYREFYNDNLREAHDPEFDPERDLPDYFTSAQDLDPVDHVRMQAAVQPYVDTSISKTINCPADIPFKSFKDVYLGAYESGCKGCTTYRPNDVTGSVLSVEDKPKEVTRSIDESRHTVAVEQPSPEAVQAALDDEPKKRPSELPGATYKLRWPNDPHAIYVTITDIVEDGRTRPFEVFINSKNTEHFAWITGLTRMISAVFRRPHDSSFVARELQEVFDPRGGAWLEGGYHPSILALIGKTIERHMRSLGYGEFTAPGFDKGDIVVETPAAPQLAPKPCKNCGGFNIRHESGCTVCADCGHSSCG